jgi:hypothetical protein
MGLYIFSSFYLYSSNYLRKNEIFVGHNLSGLSTLLEEPGSPSNTDKRGRHITCFQISSLQAKCSSSLVLPSKDYTIGLGSVLSLILRSAQSNEHQGVAVPMAELQFHILSPPQSSCLTIPEFLPSKKWR